VVQHGRDDPRAAATPEPRLRERLGLGNGRIVLAVSAAKEHKNLARLVEAMQRVASDHPDALLVAPGNRTELHARLERRARELGVDGNVRFPGWVEAPDLEGLYAACSAFACPSLVEGFGLPVLEAMARGAPVTCARASSLPEVAGDAALYFDPLAPAEMAQAISRLLGDPELARDLARRGLERSHGFTWRRAAELTVACYERAVGPAPDLPSAR
jgi:glycosyltransferase involved in cell wall biosynthesis